MMSSKRRNIISLVFARLGFCKSLLIWNNYQYYKGNKGRCKESTIRGHRKKIWAPDGIRTHNPPCVSVVLGWLVGGSLLLMWLCGTVKPYVLPVMDCVTARCGTQVQPTKMTLARQRVPSSSEVRASDLEHGGPWVRIPSGAQIFLCVLLWLILYISLYFLYILNVFKHTGEFVWVYFPYLVTVHGLW